MRAHLAKPPLVISGPQYRVLLTPHCALSFPRLASFLDDIWTMDDTWKPPGSSGCFHPLIWSMCERCAGLEYFVVYSFQLWSSKLSRNFLKKNHPGPIGMEWWMKPLVSLVQIVLVWTKKFVLVVANFEDRTRLEAIVFNFVCLHLYSPQTMLLSSFLSINKVYLLIYSILALCYWFVIHPKKSQPYCCCLFQLHICRTSTQQWLICSKKYAPPYHQICVTYTQSPRTKDLFSGLYLNSA